MLDKKQKAAIMKLFSVGVDVSEIAEKVKVSKESVYRLIDSIVERDPYLKRLERDLKVAELRRRLSDVGELSFVRGAVDRLFSRVLSLWSVSPEIKDERQVCVYCNGPMRYVEERTSSGEIVHGYRCDRCRKAFPFRKFKEKNKKPDYILS